MKYHVLNLNLIIIMQSHLKLGIFFNWIRTEQLHLEFSMKTRSFEMLKGTS